MKIVVIIARILLGLIFLFFGLNGFLHFPFLNAPLPPGLAGQFVGAMAQSHYDLVVSGIQVISGVLLLVNRYVPFALTILGPVIVNILLFHICLLPIGMAPGIVSAILWIILFIRYREYFSGIFVQRAQ
jgi:putative oxidoreductase